MQFTYEGGEFIYESPDLIKGLRMVGKMKRAFPDGELTEDELLAGALEVMSPLVSEIKIDGEESTWENLLKDKRARVEVIKAADHMIGELFLDQEKKSDSKNT